MRTVCLTLRDNTSIRVFPEKVHFVAECPNGSNISFGIHEVVHVLEHVDFVENEICKALDNNEQERR